LTETSLLLPGVGAQGGQVTADLKRLLTARISLVPQSRSLAEPGADDTSWQHYGAKVAERIRRAAAELSL
jgi:hypothetical protein